MNTKKIIYVAVAVILVLVVVFVMWKKSARDAAILANPPIEKHLFVVKTDGEFAPGQRQILEEFTARIVNRGGLGIQLTEREKEIFNAVISEEEMVLPHGEIVLNQAVLKFSAEELRFISDALKK